MTRLAVVAGVAVIVVGAVVASRDETTSAPPSRLTFVQPKDRIQADGGFTPNTVVADLPQPAEREVAELPEPADSTELSVAAATPLPPPRPRTPGYYYELMRAQGDGEEGEYVLAARECRPGIDMPEPCYFPERERRNFPLRRE